MSRTAIQRIQYARKQIEDYKSKKNPVGLDGALYELYLALADLTGRHIAELGAKMLINECLAIVQDEYGGDCLAAHRILERFKHILGRGGDSEDCRCIEETLHAEKEKK